MAITCLIFFHLFHAVFALQEFRRHATSLGASRDRVQLLRGSSERSPMLGGPGHNTSGALLRERGQISGANSAVSLKFYRLLAVHYVSSEFSWDSDAETDAPECS